MTLSFVITLEEFQVKRYAINNYGSITGLNWDCPGQTQMRDHPRCYDVHDNDDDDVI